MGSVQHLVTSRVDLKVHGMNVAESKAELGGLCRQLAVNGLVAAGLSTADHLKPTEQSRTLPLVLFSSYEDAALSSVDADNVQGGRMAAEFFIAHGHTHLGMLTGPLDSRNALDRQKGYRAAILAAGLPVRDAWFSPGVYGAQPGYEAAPRLFASKRHPTAVFCANDDIASGALRAFRERGLHCPRNISVIGFDDFMVARYTTPPLTTIAQPIEEMVRLAVQHILQMMRHGAPVVRMVVPVHLVDRAAVGRVK